MATLPALTALVGLDGRTANNAFLIADIMGHDILVRQSHVLADFAKHGLALGAGLARTTRHAGDGDWLTRFELSDCDYLRLTARKVNQFSQ